MHLSNILLVRLLNELSIPSFYDHAPVGTALPFIAIHMSQPEGFRADNVNKLKRWDVRLDLYTVEKNPDTEAIVEALLEQIEVPWAQSEEYIDEQACFEIEYEFQILGEVEAGDYPEPDPEPDPPEPGPDPDPEPEPDGDGDG